MSWTRWLRGSQRKHPPIVNSPRATRHPKRPRSQLSVEVLEARVVPAVRAVSLADTTMLSDTAAGNVQGPASVSSNGRYVVYTDTAANLSPGQIMAPESSANVFLFDRATGTTTLVSHAAGSSTITANGTSKNAALSADGNWVAYVSNSDNLVSGETLPGSSPNEFLCDQYWVFLYSVQSHQTTVVSHIAGTTTLSDGTSGLLNGFNGSASSVASLTTSVSISGNGQYVAYTSSGTQLVSGEQNFNAGLGFVAANAFVYDRAADVNYLVSRQFGSSLNGSGAATTPGDNTCYVAVISQDGGTIAFGSMSANLVQNQFISPTYGDIQGETEQFFVARRNGSSWLSETTSLASHDQTGPARESITNTSSFPDYPAPVLTPDGHWLVYVTDNAIVQNPISGTFAGQGDDVYLYDTTNPNSVANVTLVSHTPGNTQQVGNAGPTTYTFTTTAPAPAVSDDGRFVAFVNSATDLTATASSTGYNVFVFDRLAADPTHNVTRVTHKSITTANIPATSYMALTPTISGNGRYIGYVGYADQDITGLANINTLSGTKGLDALVYDQGPTPGTSTPTYLLISHDTALATKTANAEAYVPVVSQDGSTVLYLDDATNLIPAGQDLNAALPNDGTDLYAYSLAPTTGYTAPAAVGTNATVTLRDPSLPTLTANGLSEVTPVHAVSDDGRYTVFFSNAPNLVAGEVDTGLTLNVYLFDKGPTPGVSTPTVTLISHAAGLPTTTANGESTNAVISGDGKTVLFYSFATNLLAGETFTGTGSSHPELYLYDNNPTAGTYQQLLLVSHTTSAIQAANATAPFSPAGTSTLLYSSALAQGLALPSVSADGQYVAYLSNATNLSAANTGTNRINAFLFDRGTGVNTMISHASGLATTGSANTDTVSISADGGTVAFTSKATNLLATTVANNGGDQLYVWKRVFNTTVLASHAAGANTNAASFNTATGTGSSLWGPLPASLSANGAFVAYYFGGNNLVAGQAGTASATNVFLYDVLNNANTLVSHASGSAAAAGDNPTNSNQYEASGPAISTDGRFIAYANNSTNLTPAPLAGQAGKDNVYLYDVTQIDPTLQNTLVSHAANLPGTPDAGGGTSASMSANGRYVAFLDLALDTTADVNCTFTGTGTVRLFDAQAAAAQPTAVGNAFDPTAMLLVGATLAPTLLSADGGTVAWDGLAATTVTGDLNSNLDVFITMPVNTTPGPTNITFALDPTPITAGRPVSTTVGTLSTSTTGTSNTFTYTLVTGGGGTDNSKFSLSTTGTLTTNQFFLNTVSTNYSILVKTTDGNNQSFIKVITITVLPSTTPPTDITATPATLTVVTNQSTGTTVGNLVTTDPNSGVTTWNYTILNTGTPPLPFTISNNSIVTNQVLTTTATYSLQIQTTNALNQVFNKFFSVTVVAPPQITALSKIFTAGQPNTFQLTATGTPPINYAVGTGVNAPPSWVTLSSTGVLTGTPPVGTNTTFSFQVTATNSVGSDPETFSLTVVAPPLITTLTKTFTAGQAGTFQLSATGTTPIAYVAGTGVNAPPAWLSLSSAGVLSGTAPAGTNSSFSFLVTAANVAGSDPETFTLTVVAAPQITTLSKTFVAGQSGTFQLAATGTTPITYVAGTGVNAPPAWLALSSAGVLSGTAPAGTNTTFTFQVTASNNVGSDPESFSLTVIAAPRITTLSRTFTSGQSGTFQLAATGTTPITYVAGTGVNAPPAWLSLSAAGLLSGTPPTGTNTTFTFQITATNGVGSDPETFSLTVVSAPQITSLSNTFAAGQSGSFQLAATGTTPITYVAGTGVNAPPAWLSLSAAGVLSGTPPTGTNTTFTFQVTASNSVGSDPETFSLTVTPAPVAPTITTLSKTFVAGQPVTFQLAANGTMPINYVADTGSNAPPAWLTLSAAGVLSGTAPAFTTGTFTFLVTADNSAGSDAETFTLTVVSPPHISTLATTFLAGQPGTSTLTASGTTPITYTTGTGGNAPPAWLTLSAAGVLNGTPPLGTSGSFTFQVTATNGIGSDPETFTLNVSDIKPVKVYVNNAWTGLAPGSDPDGTGPATILGYDAFTTIQQGINGVIAGGTVVVIGGGTYQENLTITKPLALEGGGATLTSPTPGVGTGLTASGSTVSVAGLTLRNFATGIDASAYVTTLILTDVHLFGNTNGGILSSVATVQYNGSAASESFTVDKTQFGRAGEDALHPFNVMQLVLDGKGGGDGYYVVLEGLGNGVHIADSSGTGQAAFVGSTAHDALVVGDGQVSLGTDSASFSGLTTAVIGGGGGDDGFFVRTTQSTATTIVVDGGSGTNYLVDDLSSVTAGDQLYVTNNTIFDTVLNSRVIYLASGGGNFASGIYVYTGSGNDAAVVVSTRADSPTTVHTGAGNDTLIVASTAMPANSTLSGIAGVLQMEGGSGTNALVVSDAGNTAANTIAVTNNAIIGLTQPFTIYYLATGGTNAQVQLDIGAGSTVVVEGQAPGVPLVVYGTANNTFDVAVNAYSGYRNVTLLGGAGTNTLNVVDQFGSPSMSNVVSGPGQGTVDVQYAGGFESQVNYYGMQSVGTSADPQLSYIRAVYQDVLFRATTPQDEVWARSVLNGPGGTQAFLSVIEKSPEAKALQVAGWFAHYAGPPNARAQDWVNKLSTESYNQALSEFLAGAGGTDDQFIGQLYFELLGRAPSAADVSSLEQVLPRLGRQQVALMVLTSPEFEQDEAAADYRAFLGRDATAAELAVWANSTLDKPSMDAVFLASPEFQTPSSVKKSS